MEKKLTPSKGMKFADLPARAIFRTVDGAGSLYRKTGPYSSEVFFSKGQWAQSRRFNPEETVYLAEPVVKIRELTQGEVLFDFIDQFDLIIFHDAPGEAWADKNTIAHVSDDRVHCELLRTHPDWNFDDSGDPDCLCGKLLDMVEFCRAIERIYGYICVEWQTEEYKNAWEAGRNSTT